MPRKKENKPEAYYDTFPTMLRKIMEEQEKTQQDVAEAIGKTRQAVGYYRDGSSSPDWKTLVSLARYFGVSTDYLLGLSSTSSANPKIKEICEYTGLSEKAVEVLSFYNDAEDAPLISVVSKLIEQEEWTSEVVDDGICDEYGNPVMTILDGVMSETPILSTIKNFLAIEHNSQKVYQLVGEEFFDKRGLIVRDTLRHIPVSEVKTLILLNDIEVMLKKFKEKNIEK